MTTSDATPPAEYEPDLDEMARHVIDTNAYMVLGTLDPDGSPRVSRSRHRDRPPLARATGQPDQIVLSA
jgi:predicted pyridoxine 5'-phosphate oxidase superfamily flavin-nucleotide-binding protein